MTGCHTCGIRTSAVGQQYTPIEELVKDLAGPLLRLPDGALGPLGRIIISGWGERKNDEAMEHLQPLTEGDLVHNACWQLVLHK
jgi:hypothetical protein